MRIRRIFLIVLDGVGIGELPDAGRFGDEGSNTLANTSLAVGGLEVPCLAALGLGNLGDFLGVPASASTLGSYGKMAEASAGKDTLTGHWEMMGVPVSSPFPVFPGGFPEELITEFERRIGKCTLGNKPASGTAIIEELGEEHLRTSFPIIYTSADSVFQIAAHKEVVDLEELYRMCKVARDLLQGEYGVARVIARPFVGRPGSFGRTPERRDFSLLPCAETTLDRIAAAGFSVWGVGKIEDVFGNRGLTNSCHTRGNRETFGFLHHLSTVDFTGLAFANCGDFDTLYGHRNDPGGFARAFLEADREISRLVDALRPEDLLIITADHGCDPTTPSTDHSREYVPLLVTGPQVKPGALGLRRTFADVGASVEELLLGESKSPGESFVVGICR